MISKKTEEEIVDLLGDETASNLLERENLDPETRRVLEKMVVLENDFRNIDELYPPVPEFHLPDEKPARGGYGLWYMLPVAALLVLGLFFMNQPEPEDVFRGEPETPKTAQDLFTAASGGDPNLLEQLLDSGAPVNGINEEGRTALMLAALENDAPVLEMLIRFGAAVNQVDPQGKTALMLAAGEGHPESTRLLLEHGADRNMTDNQGDTAMDLARENDYQEVLSILESF